MQNTGMAEWFKLCQHCYIEAPHNSLHQDDDDDGRVKLYCADCKLKCSYNIVRFSPDTKNERSQGVSTLSSPDGQSIGGSSIVQALSENLSKFCVTSPKHSTHSTVAESEDEIQSELSDDIGKATLYRTLANMNLSGGEIKEIKQKYILAESVTESMALMKVEEKLYQCDFEKEIFVLRMPGKSESNLYVYDENLKQICRLRKPDYKISQAKACRFAHILLIIKDLLSRSTKERLRLLHYKHKQLQTNEDHEKSMTALRTDVDDVCVMLEITRDSLNISAFPQGLVVGPVVVYAGKDVLVDCNYGGSSGNLIPSEVEEISRIEGDVNFILLVEKDTIFYSLAAKKFHVRNNCVLITGKGVPDVYTRIFLRKLKDQLKGVPIYGFFDGNPSGSKIFCNYCYGSEDKAHEGLFMTVSDLLYIGVFLSDVDTENRSPLTPNDLSVLDSLLKKNYIEHSGLFRKNLVTMEQTNCKADIEMLMRQHKLEEFLKEAMLKVSRSSGFGLSPGSSAPSSRSHMARSKE